MHNHIYQGVHSDCATCQSIRPTTQTPLYVRTSLNDLRRNAEDHHTTNPVSPALHGA